MRKYIEKIFNINYSLLRSANLCLPVCWDPSSPNLDEKEPSCPKLILLTPSLEISTPSKQPGDCASRPAPSKSGDVQEMVLRSSRSVERSVTPRPFCLSGRTVDADFGTLELVVTGRRHQLNCELGRKVFVRGARRSTGTNFLAPAINTRTALRRPVS